MSPDSQGFLNRFEAHWKAPRPETFKDLFMPGATSLHPPGTVPTRYDELDTYFRDDLLAIAPDIKLKVRNWASVDNVVLIEWTLNAHINGKPVEINGADRFTLDGARAVQGVAYFDPAPMLAALGLSLQKAAA